VTLAVAPHPSSTSPYRTNVQGRRKRSPTSTRLCPAAPYGGTEGEG
jgi:hypothetical protein